MRHGGLRTGASWLAAGVPLLAACLGGADAARAELIGIAFSGTIDEVEGTPPGGGLAAGEAFSGLLRFDPDAASLPYVFWSWDGFAELRVSAGGVGYQTDPTRPRVEIDSMWTLVNVNSAEIWDQPFPPPDPTEFALHAGFAAGSSQNREVEGWFYSIGLRHVDPLPSHFYPWVYPEPVPLPRTDEALAEAFLDSRVWVRSYVPSLHSPFWSFSGMVTEVTPILRVSVDVRPGRRRNWVRPDSAGRVPVAILGSRQLDVRQVDGTTLAFGPFAARPVLDQRNPWVALLSRVWDVNRDRRRDFISSYRIAETGIAYGDEQACLTGELVDGTPFHGCDAIRTPPSPPDPPQPEGETGSDRRIFWNVLRFIVLPEPTPP